jgi:hypothetical protein
MRFELAWEKLWPRVEVTGFCWLWQGERNEGGYGRLQWQGSRWYARRLIYTLLVGVIPRGLQLDHLCRVPACVNPDHLEPVTGGVNLSRRVFVAKEPKPKSVAQLRKERGECRKGHALADVGVLLSKNANGSTRKQCRACQHDVQERYRRKAGIPEKGRYNTTPKHMGLDLLTDVL